MTSIFTGIVVAEGIALPVAVVLNLSIVIENKNTKILHVLQAKDRGWKW